MSKFTMRMVVPCDKCKRALVFVDQPDGSFVYWHEGSGCERDFEMYKAVEIELTQIPTVAHPQV